MDNLLETAKIKSQLKEKELSSQNILDQVVLFTKGMPPVELVKPCTVGDGVISLSDSEIDNFIRTYDENISSVQSSKFVPASGAATRMFKDLLSEYAEMKTGDNLNGPNTSKLIENLQHFAFASDLNNSNANAKETLENLLFEPGLNYSKIPKGLIKFHKYDDSSRTAFEEHLVEGAQYLGDELGNCTIHFTVPPDYRSDIEEYLESKQYDFQDEDKKFNLEYSIQNPSTDTIAVNTDNTPYVGADGKLVFRPAGHGALIENLDGIDSDYIFIKNIDNVTTEKYLPETVKYKKVIGGYLFSVKKEINKILLDLEDVNIDSKRKDEIITFCKEILGLEITEGISVMELADLLNRPVRVCGVVKNEGEPGGGPFWIKKSGKLSKQIVESAQVDMEDDNQSSIWGSSTHFNPVDLVCSVRDYRGNKFDLENFIDHDAGIITNKSIDGTDIKALELPGLWNGAMAKWITLFVEVPLITFNPVKTVFDLLRKEHQV